MQSLLYGYENDEDDHHNNVDREEDTKSSPANWSIFRGYLWLRWGITRHSWFLSWNGQLNAFVSRNRLLALLW